VQHLPRERESTAPHWLNAVAFHKFQREEAFLVQQREGTIFCAAVFESVLREDPSPREPSKAFLVARIFPRRRTYHRRRHQQTLLQVAPPTAALLILLILVMITQRRRLLFEVAPAVENLI
jgi:hypothetical protein